MAIETDKTRSWDRTTLNDGIYFEDEFNRVYDNMVDVDGRVKNIDDNLSTISQYAYSQVSLLMAGMIQGGTYWDQSGGGKGATAIRQGRYDVAGKLNVLLADLPTNPVTHNYGNSGLEDDYWYYTLMDSTGNVRQQMAADTALLSGLSVNSVADEGSGVFKITFRDSPDLSGVSTDMIFRSDDLGSGNSGLFRITSVNTGAFQIQVSNVRGGTLTSGADPVGTGGIYERISILKTPNPSFDVIRQGYYDGDWRILGVDYYDFTDSHRHVLAYKSGYKKNDNELVLQHFERYADSSQLIIYLNVLRNWGNDYVFDDTTGTSLTFNRPGKVYPFMYFQGGNPATYFGFTHNITAAERQMALWSVSPMHRLCMNHTANGVIDSCSGTGQVKQGDVIYAHGGGAGPLDSGAYDAAGASAQGQCRVLFEPE